MSARRVAALLLALFVIPTAGAQTGAVVGRVVDAETRAPLPGVAVVLEGTATGAASDTDGAFRIAGVEPGAYTVVARFLGYAPARRAVVVEPGEDAEVSLRL